MGAQHQAGVLDLHQRFHGETQSGDDPPQISVECGATVDQIRHLVKMAGLLLKDSWGNQEDMEVVKDQGLKSTVIASLLEGHSTSKNLRKLFLLYVNLSFLSCHPIKGNQRVKGQSLHVVHCF
jgi:hypothetical protein